MNSTLATVIVLAADQAAAQLDFPFYFTAPASADGILPVTHYLTNGYFEDTELDTICNDSTWPRKVYFGALEVGLQKAGLMLVQEVQLVLEVQEAAVETEATEAA
jgi:hypothetical protein